MPDLWLEKELTRQLTPVLAPESLWDRVNRPEPKPYPGIRIKWLFWPVAVMMLLLVLAGVLRSSGTEQDLAALPAAPTRVEFHPADFESARTWLKAQVDIDVDLPAIDPPTGRSGIQVLSARVVQFHGLPIAAIDCRIGNRKATLFVSGQRGRNAEQRRHLFSRTATPGQQQLVSWNMRGQTYAIAFSDPEAERAACLLCHANTPGLLVSMAQ